MKAKCREQQRGQSKVGRVRLLMLIFLLPIQAVHGAHDSLVNNLSASNSLAIANAGAPAGFEVWLYDEYQLQASIRNVQRTKRAQESSAGKGSSLEMCINSNESGSPAHLMISIEPDQGVNLERYQSRYSFNLYGQRTWRSEQDFFDYLLHATAECPEGQMLEFRYKVEVKGPASLGQKRFPDTIRLTIGPE